MLGYPIRFDLATFKKYQAIIYSGLHGMTDQELNEAQRALDALLNLFERVLLEKQGDY